MNDGDRRRLMGFLYIFFAFVAVFLAVGLLFYGLDGLGFTDLLKTPPEGMES